MSARSRFDILLISDEHLFMQMGTTWEENEGGLPKRPYEVYIANRNRQTSKTALVVEWLTYSLRVEFRT
jgi:hypothetical protein